MNIFKRTFILVLLLSFVACQPSDTTSYRNIEITEHDIWNVTLYTSRGGVIRTWENVDVLSYSTNDTFILARNEVRIAEITGIVVVERAE